MLEIKEDGKFFTRLLTKESSKGNPYDQSFRVYYGGVPLGVPFLWEAKPGTPKHLNHPISSYDHDHHDDHDHDLSIPPLTPPPSYSLGTCDPRAKKLIKSSLSNKKSKIFNGLGLFPKMIMHHRRQISMSSTSSSSGTESVPDKTRIQTRTRTRTQTQTQTHIEMSLLDDHEEEHLEEKEEEMRCGSNTTLCFGLVGSRKIS